MDVIPAIDLLNGECVRLYQGDYDQAEVFSPDPVAIAQRWQAEGATRLHLVDLDGAKQGATVNHAAIAAVVKAVSIPVEVGGGLRSLESVGRMFELGVQWAIVGTVAVENPDAVRQWCQQFPGRIIVGIDARAGKVATKGWLETSTVQATDLARQMADDGAAAIIYTDIHRDGTLSGPNLDALRELAQTVPIPVIASGGVSSLTDVLSLLSLEAIGVSGMIIGRAIYTGDVVLSEAVKAVGQGRWQDIPPGGGPRLA
ncbi:MAG: 1-(5-phosphoribosyl)-5-[(5-phosphoribosylamino)methylideneamino]imidazole-4-carboxamide isomerase [Cyanobacteria bacterium P01_G01_bin.54]